jgi:hypothetical protein
MTRRSLGDRRVPSLSRVGHAAKEKERACLGLADGEDERPVYDEVDHGR